MNLDFDKRVLGNQCEPTQLGEGVQGDPAPVGEASSGARWFPAAALFSILALTALLYGRTLSFPFVFDDWVYIIENPLIKDMPSFRFWLEPREFAALPSKLDLNPDVATNIMLRPFTYFTFYLNRMAGGDHPAGFRLVNVVLHGANGCLLFLILRHIMLRSRFAGARSSGSAMFIPAVSALLFVAHPIQIESVTYVIQRFTSMAAFFFLLTIWVHLLAGEAGGVVARRILRITSVVVAITGMFAKEDVFMVPAMIVLIDWLLMGNALKPVLRRALPLLCCMAIVPALVLFVASAQSEAGLTLNSAINVANSREHSDAHLPYLLNEFRVILVYLRLLLFPAGLNIDPDFRPAESLLDWRILLSGAGIVCIVAAAWAVFRRRSAGLRGAMIFVFTLWFFAIISISSGIVPLPDLMAEHRAYLPSVGAIVALVCAIDMLRTHALSVDPWKHLVRCAVASWIGILCWATVERNEVWRSRRSLWEDSVAKSPGKARPLANLGACHGEAGRLDAAVACFERALAIDPRAFAAHENLATIMVTQQKFDAARDVCVRAIAVGVDSCTLRHNLGVALFNTGRQEEGIASLYEALKRRPDFRPTLFALGQAHAVLGQTDKALACYRRAASLGPEAAVITQAILELEKKAREGGSGGVAR